MELLIPPSGVIRCLYGETLDLTLLGNLQLARASHVEPNPDGSWTADLAPLAGPLLGPFPHRSAALQAEQEWLVQHWLRTDKEFPRSNPPPRTAKDTLMISFHSLPRLRRGSQTESPKFPAGQIVITPTAQQALSQSDVNTALARHLSGDWGDCGAEDAAENELSLTEGLRLFSVYHGAGGIKFWIITEADRSVTTILLPEDY